VLEGLPTPIDPSLVPSFAASTALWLYVLYEAQHVYAERIRGVSPTCKTVFTF